MTDHHNSLAVAERTLAQFIEHIGADHTDAESIRLKFLAEVRRGEDGAVTFTDSNGAPLLDPERGHASADLPFWLRRLVTDRPHLKAKPTKPSGTATPPETTPYPRPRSITSTVSVAPGSLSALMADAAAGSPGAGDALRAKLAPAATGATNLTQLMAAAKRGNASALALLNEKLKS